MSLIRVLQIKIVTTLVFWCLPLLILPPSFFEWLGIPSIKPFVFIRLLGAAYLALVIGYGIALRDMRCGKEANYVRAMGLVSNGVASLILFVFGLMGAWQDWGLLAQIFMWFSAGMTGFLTFALGLSK